ncbi:iron-sulfur cluster biosynthesis family protein [Thermotalea metallivorans]|uniref:Iron-sulfur cluster insertion protein ErpA n=1 Tax=Thermotalea metallivorans TaxID=520762 RepID=A0A140L161_9FIRM|nr:iron-sulfur cluster biosynthesis family protein [Thermotalea metallivorans]KXG74286.1 hypothetical protein AN619_24780 [Thermotalea metallivorans]
MHITITQKAQEMIKQQLKDKNMEEKFLRIVVKAFG